MKRLIAIASILSFFVASAQVSEGGLPHSFILKKHQITIDADYAIEQIDQPNSDVLNVQDKSAEDKGKPFRVAVNMDVSYTIHNSGTWTTLPTGDKIWRLGIKIKNAKALGLYLNDNLNIPEGGKLHIYNENHSQFIGAYTSLTDNFTAFEMIQGELLTLEYFMPKGSTTLPIINIGKVAYFYRGVGERMQIFERGQPLDIDRAGNCQVDVKCSEINGWEHQRDAVVKYTFVVGSNTFECSGTILNNTAEDCKPYILTANHCGEPTNSSAVQNNVWYFNYQRNSCAPGNTIPYSGAQSETMSGGSFRASSSLGNYPATNVTQVDGTDFALLELSDTIPSSYNPYYAGWSRSNSNSPSGVSIHHPSGDEKKISTYATSLASFTYNGGWTNAHWRVFWSATTNGHGVTEGGSSGAPLFNNNGLVIGLLSGGSSFCSSPGLSDLFGKFNLAWNQDGSTISSQLQPWLDPGNTGVTELAGTYTPCNTNISTYCDASSIHCDEYISNITLGGISNSSACTNYNHYWQNQPVGISPGSAYFLNITTGVIGGSTIGYEGDQIAVWIDWNADGDFDDINEMVYSHVISSSTTLPLQTIISVPANDISFGETRMRARIMFDVATEGPITPCGVSGFGEVEDYQLKIGGELGIESLTQDNINIFPNPSTGFVNIDLSGLNEAATSLSITDMTGKIVLDMTPDSETVNIDLNDVAKGVYFVKVSTQDKHRVQKIVLK